MQSSWTKPAQAGIIVAANYAKNTVCWPIIVPIRQTRRVITCQVLKINTVLVKYYRITMQIQRTQGVLPHVGYNTLTLGARGFSCALSGFGILGKQRAWVSRFGRKGATKVFENFRRAFSPDPTDCPWVFDSEDAVSVKSVEDMSACGRRSSSSHARKENLWYPRPGYNTLHICWNTSHFTPTPTLIHVSPICKYTRISTLGKERTSKLEEK